MHGCFLQTGTDTGRLAMTEPSLHVGPILGVFFGGWARLQSMHQRCYTQVLVLEWCARLVNASPHACASIADPSPH